MSSNQRARGVILVLLLVSFIVLSPSLMRMAIVPGPEGLNVELYGVQFGSYSNDLHLISEIRNNQILESGTTVEAFYIPGTQWGTTTTAHMGLKCSFPEPRNTVFRKTVEVQQDVVEIRPSVVVIELMERAPNQ